MLEIKPLAITEEHVVEAVVDRIVEQSGERFNTAVRGAIKETIDAKLSKLVEETLRPAVAEIIAEGWQETNRYGEPQGRKLDLKARVSEMLNKNDGYDRLPFIQKTAQEILDKALRAELGALIEEAKKKFRDQIDGVLQAKFKEALQGALGLPVPR